MNECTKEQIWAAAFANYYSNSSIERAERSGHGWDDFIDAKTELAKGIAEDAATFADWTLKAYQGLERNSNKKTQTTSNKKQKTIGYALTPNQHSFVREAQEQSLEIDYSYSGRGMFGVKCPAVRISKNQLWKCKFTAEVSHDQMGLGYVVYASF